RAPGAEASDVVVGGGPIRQLQHAGGAAAHDGEEVAHGEGIGVAADAVPEVPGDLAGHVAQGHAAAVARVPDARVDVAGIGALRVLEILGEPSLPCRVLAGHDAPHHRDGAQVELLELV